MRVDGYRYAAAGGVGGEGEEGCLCVGGGDAFVLVNPFEVGGEECVLRDYDSAWVGGVAVVPVGEAVAFRRDGGECGGVAIPELPAN